MKKWDEAVVDCTEAIIRSYESKYIERSNWYSNFLFIIIIIISHFQVTVKPGRFYSKQFIVVLGGLLKFMITRMLYKTFHFVIEEMVPQKM